MSHESFIEIFGLMQEIDYNDDSKESKLRRWVANLQLESWQLELLITGFSIFLLASAYGEYQAWREGVNFNKFITTIPDNAMVISVVGRIITGTIPWAIQFFLITLLIHLLLRGLWNTHL